MLGNYTINVNIKFPQLIGNKGAGIMRMRNLGLPVPPAFVIFCSATGRYQSEGPAFITNELSHELMARLGEIEVQSQRRYGDPVKPLLLSIRSGAPVSMPGMMDSILNVGINDEIREGMAKRTGNREWALDCHLRFLQMVGRVIFKLEDMTPPNTASLQSRPGWKEELLADYKNIIGKAAATSPFPDILTDVKQQLYACIMGVFSSWHNDRAIRYRRMFKIPESLGLGIVVQTMVFGNLDNRSSTGVVFSRDPSTGENKLTGEYLIGHQGEDVVSGEFAEAAMPIAQLEQVAPEIYKLIERGCRLLELRNGDIQDVEFTVEHGRLFFLQVRNAKSTALAKLQFLVDAVDEIMSENEALRRAAQIPKEAIRANIARNKVIASGYEGGWILARGIGVSPGVARGKLVLSRQSASVLQPGDEVVMITEGTTVADIMGVKDIKGWLTVSGGAVSHATVVCREMGIPCVVNTGLKIDKVNSVVVGIDGAVLHEGDMITIDGSSGLVCGGNPRIKDAGLSLALEGLINKVLDESC